MADFKYILEHNAVAAIHHADAMVDRGEITIGEYEAMIKPWTDAEPVKHGRWKVLASGNDAVCTNCKHYWIQNGDQYDYHYCPNCGARMDAQIGEDKSHPFAESVMMGMDGVEE